MLEQDLSGNQISQSILNRFYSCNVKLLEVRTHVID